MSVSVVSLVLLPADNYDLTDLDTARDELKIAAADTENDAWLTRAITEESARAQDYVERPFAVESMQDTFLVHQEPRRYSYRMPSGITLLQLSRWPVLDVLSILETTAPDVTADLTEGEDFVVDRKRGQITRLDPDTGAAVTWQTQTIVVEYDAGFTTMPPAVTGAVLRLIVGRWHQRGRDPLLLEQVTPMVGTQRWWVGGPKSGGPMPSEVQGMLDIYRMPTAV